MNDLEINPRVLGMLIDETGCTSVGKLILSPKAWHQLLAVTKQELAELDSDSQQYVEQRFLFSRMTLVFGWFAEENDASVGRLCIWDIQS